MKIELIPGDVLVECLVFVNKSAPDAISVLDVKSTRHRAYSGLRDGKVGFSPEGTTTSPCICVYPLLCVVIGLCG